MDELGLNTGIERRDFIGMLLGGACGAAFPRVSMGSAGSPRLADAADLVLSAEEFDGYGGTGDYAGSNGNIWKVVNSAHRIRDGLFNEGTTVPVEDTGETYDLAVVGGGPSGLGSAYYFRKHSGKGASCLVLDNHPMFGGLAKRNEMLVNGVRLMAPQGSNVFSSSTQPAPGRVMPVSVLEDIGLAPGEMEYGPLTGTDRGLEFDRTNFVYYYPPANSDSLGFFFDTGKGYALSRNPWAVRFRDAPIGDRLKQELLRWRFDAAVPDHIGDRDAWLDSMTFQDYLRKVHGFSTETCALINKFIGGGKAFNGEICSAFALSFNRYPGLEIRPFLGIEEIYQNLEAGPLRADGFPGGNGMTTRYFAKYLVPDLIPGETSPSNIINSKMNMAALDRPDQPTRIRLNATVVAVRHLGAPEKAGKLEIIYEREGRLFRVLAKAAVMASGAWVTRHIVRDAPAQLTQALWGLKHSPVLVANVALTNWRFMEKAGVTACLWDDGDFGFQCNLRRPLHDGDYRPPLDPDKPIFLTFYAPFVYPGQPADVQTSLGRMELLSTPFRDFEFKIRRQLARMFGDYGFDPVKDIAGIILNRWGHAYVVPEPGFYFGRNGEPAAREVIRNGYGRVGFAHSELSGFQSYQTAVLEAKRAIDNIVKVL